MANASPPADRQKSLVLGYGDSSSDESDHEDQADPAPKADTEVLRLDGENSLVGYDEDYDMSGPQDSAPVKQILPPLQSLRILGRRS